MRRAAQQMTSASRSRLADWSDAKGTDEKAAFPREGQQTRLFDREKPDNLQLIG